jgi:sulfatase maturation enzyme AslB (radical SAM superfamily)
MFVPDIKEIHVEPTTVCQAECSMCARTILKYNTDKSKNTELSLKDFKKLTVGIVDGLEKILFCGTLGDPTAAIELLPMIEWAQERNPNIVIGINTNGALRNAAWWRKCAELISKNPYSYIVFSIDGLEDTNHIYRKNVYWEHLMENANTFIQAGGVAQWDMLVFDHNKHQVEQAHNLAQQMGFRLFRSKVSTRFAAQPDTEVQPPNLQMPTIEPDQFSCMAMDTKSIYLSAAGMWYPCCFIHDEEVRLVDNTWGNALISEEDRHQSWDTLSQSIETTPMPVCTKSCGTTLRKGQWKTETFFS